MTVDKKTAVVLFQLGGPDSLEAIQPFLYNLFMDPDIINFPGAFLARKYLAKIISRRRSVKVAENYKQIGGKSPIFELTRRQAVALEAKLKSMNINAQIFIAMRYWHPMTDAVIKEIKEGGFEQVILLPLYPQFSQATTLSSFNEWNRKAKINGLFLPTKLVCCYPSHPLLIESLVDRINESLALFDVSQAADIDLIFSAHGVPRSYIEQGDPYQLQIEETVRRVMEFGKWNSSHTLCYQSKVGPVEWLKPSLMETVVRLSALGRKNLLVIPVAFVSDHIETLHEINIDVRRHAMLNGVQQFELMPALNDYPKFIQCLTDLVHKQLAMDGRFTTCELLGTEHPHRSIPKKCPWM